MCDPVTTAIVGDELFNDGRGRQSVVAAAAGFVARNPPQVPELPPPPPPAPPLPIPEDTQTGATFAQIPNFGLTQQQRAELQIQQIQERGLL